MVGEFTQVQVDEMNIIASFLAKQDKLPDKIDLAILLGSSLVSHLKSISELYINGRINKLMIVGGVGHSTQYLYDNVYRHETYSQYFTAEELGIKPSADKTVTEAEIHRRVLTEHYGLENEELLIED